MRSLLIFLTLYTASFGLENTDASGNTNNGYAFYYPYTMGANQPAKVCLAIDKHLLPAVVKITFENKTCEGTTCAPHTVDKDFSCWEIKAPDQEKNQYSNTKIQIQIETSDKNVKFEEENGLRIFTDNEQVMLETDRNTYKMGDTVKIRLIAFDFDLKPIPNYNVSNLRIRSPYPSNAVVKEWENVSTVLGLAHIEFQLAPDTPEGYWYIQADGLYAGFEVKKYILPRFQAILNGPDQIYNDSKSVSYTVCGKYSYGRNIKGVALLSAKTRHGYPEEPTSFSQVKNLKGGCAKFELFSEDLGLNNERTWSVDLSASVTEDGTEQVESTSKYVYINRRSYSYRWNYKNTHMKPKLPYKGEFSLDNVQESSSSPTVEMCYKVTADKSKTCSNMTLDSNNHLDFTIPPLTNVSDDSKIEIAARILDLPVGDFNPTQTITLWHSKSKNGIQIINSKKDAVNCQSSLSYTVLYNSGRFKNDEEVEFKYILTSRGDILNTGSVVNKPKKEQLNLDQFKNVIGKESYEAEPNPVDQFNLELKLDERIYTSAKLVVYYDYDNEVISDVIDIDVKACTPNHVEAEWSEKSLYPGEVGTLDIKTEKDSLCSVSSIDKASTFLGSSNHISTNNVVGRFYRYFYQYNLNCIEPKKEINKTVETTTFQPWISYRYYSPLYDSFDAFKDSNIGVMSNLQFISKECQEYPYNPIRPLSGVAYAMHTTGLAGAAGAPAVPASTNIPVSLEKTHVAEDVGSSVDNRGSAVRSFFPETWLWDLIPVREGETKVDRKLPDSITNWEGSVVCMSENEGIGISDKIEIQGFKPFFVDVLLPYSIKRNKEILHLPIPVFNYLNHSLPIRVTLETSKDIVLVDGQDKNSFTMCLEAEDSYTHNYRIKATKLGNLDITVSAESNPAYAENCAPNSVIQRRDAVKKSLLVEPEGYPSSLIKSALLCANDSAGVDNVNWEIVLPENVVPDTVDGKVSINSDILGPMFQNLESILVVPTGCGEQTMATLTPNLYVLQYLKSNNALTDKIKEKILKNLEIGYQRMLTYAHDDGSFSAFGKSDKEGSMFLTAFVIRTFRQMKQYIFIDDDVINKAIKWMISHQLKNGCFDPVHHVFHEMGLASSKNQTTALTSYVLISLLETNIKIDENVFSDAKKCIIDDPTIDKYTLAISSYALGLLNLDQEVKQRLDKLLKVAESKNGLLWWKQNEKSQSANVEVSSYVLMSLLQQDPVANLGTASSIVRWLQSQMNPRGGFFSTTDTVVGLDAISRYAILVNKKEPNVKVSLATKTDNKDVEITKRDRTKTEVLPFSVYPNEVKAKIVGDGCVAIQAAVNFYLDTPTGIDDLHLDIELKPINQKLKCSLVELKPCVSYTALGQINMAIVEVNMPSGYAADEASLHELRTNNNDKGVKKFELRRNQVVFYLTQLGSDKLCLPFKIEENLIVENVANATVKFYDYYKPEVAISKSFKLEDCDASTPVSA